MRATSTEVVYRRPNNPKLETETYNLVYKFSRIYFPQYHPKARYDADDVAGEIYMDFLKVRRTGKTLFESLRDDLPKGKKESYIKRCVITRIIDAIHKDEKTDVLSIDEYSSNEGDNWTDRGAAEDTVTTSEELLIEDTFELVEEVEMSVEELAGLLAKKQATSLGKIRKVYEELSREDALSEASQELFSKAFKMVYESKSKSFTPVTIENRSGKTSLEINGKKVTCTFGGRMYLLIQKIKEGEITKAVGRLLLTEHGFSASALDIFIRDHSDVFSYDKKSKLIGFAK
jgi:hypothetical protein